MSDTTFDVITDVKQEEIGVKSTEIARSLNVAESTIRKYANVLSQHGYVFKKGSNNNRLYTKKDYEVFSDLIDLKSKPGISLEVAAQVALTQKEERKGMIQKHKSVQDLPQLITEEIDALKNALENTATKEEITNLTRQVHFDAEITTMRIKKELKREAIKLWGDKPFEERTRRVGFFGKEEDEAKKRGFIEDYIEERFEERLRNAQS
jgi:DNA-binding transcriptional MerR regulator